MRGLALEGGGARGAYQVGVVKALYAGGHTFDGFVGTSIGAINAAILAQGDLDKAIDLWTQVSMDTIFAADEQRLMRIVEAEGFKLDAELKLALKKVVAGGGLCTKKMQSFIEQYICEEKIRSSGKDFGLVAFSLSDRKPHEVMLEDIPNGELVGYIMASASFPGFRPAKIGEKIFLDGAVYNNCPFHLLSGKGYDEIIVIRTNSYGIFPKIKDTKRIKMIAPKKYLGYTFSFSAENSKKNVELGYYDGLRYIENLRGGAYYIRAIDEGGLCARLMSLRSNAILETGKALGLSEFDEQRMLFEKIIPQLGAYLKLDKNFGYADFVVAVLEFAAQQRGIEQLKVYGFNELCSLVKSLPVKEKETTLIKRLSNNDVLARKETAVEVLVGHLL